MPPPRPLRPSSQALPKGRVFLCVARTHLQQFERSPGILVTADSKVENPQLREPSCVLKCDAGGA